MPQDIFLKGLFIYLKFLKYNFFCILRTIKNKLHEIKSKLGLGRCLEAMENINEAIIIFEENL